MCRSRGLQKSSSRWTVSCILKDDVPIKNVLRNLLTHPERIFLLRRGRAGWCRWRRCTRRPWPPRGKASPHASVPSGPAVRSGYHCQPFKAHLTYKSSCLYLGRLYASHMWTVGETNIWCILLLNFRRFYCWPITLKAGPGTKKDISEAKTAAWGLQCVSMHLCLIILSTLLLCPTEAVGMLRSSVYQSINVLVAGSGCRGEGRARSITAVDFKQGTSEDGN